MAYFTLTGQERESSDQIVLFKRKGWAISKENFFVFFDSLIVEKFIIEMSPEQRNVMLLWDETCYMPCLHFFFKIK